MKVSEVMTRGVEMVGPEQTVQEAATVMAEHDIGAVVVGSGEDIVGVLTDRDILIRVVVEGRDVRAVRVSDVMSSSLFTCRDDDGIDLAFGAMRDHQIRRLPVLDETGALIGIIVLSDLAKARPEMEGVAEALREIAEPHRHTEVAADEAADGDPGAAEGRDEDTEEPGERAGGDDEGARA